MNIGVLNDSFDGETRVSATPQTVQKYVKAGHKVLCETSCGSKAGFSDLLYQKAGAHIKDRSEVLTSDIILSVGAPAEQDFSAFRKNQWFIGNLGPSFAQAQLKELVQSDIGLIDLSKMPRISRAQSMDVLSSQSALAGYKAALFAIDCLNKSVPLLMTAAGTLPPAQALVVGAGVAGLQAASTLKRMGANVIASDIRQETMSEVQSVGAKFTQNFFEELPTSDILITCAFSYGKKAPLLIDKAHFNLLPFGAVAIDLSGANIEKSDDRPDIFFAQDSFFERKIAQSASFLFANNVYHFLSAFDFFSEHADFEDELFSAVCICFGGFLRGKIR
ncbi:MAG: hypothetical protein J5895_01655 [Alphaproteobacteria bacterium]|nr:hypothetical protein [Alphaproteobacteria bacterium]